MPVSSTLLPAPRRAWLLPLLLLLLLPFLGALDATAVRAEDEEPADEAEEPADEEAAEPAPELPWIADIQEAKAEAAREGKDILIDFTGSDWCGWCKRLDSEVFSKAAFVKAATKDFVFLYLDFPRSEEAKAKVVDPEQNEELKDAYGVAGFPTIILATKDLIPYGRTGYQEGGPEAYLENLDELREGGQAVKALLADVKHEDKEALVAAFPVLAEQGFLGHPAYDWTLAAAEKADPEGELGLMVYVEQEKQRRLAAAEEKELRALLPQSPGEQPDLEKIQAFVRDSKYLAGVPFLNLGFQLTNWLLQQERPEDALKLLARLAEDPIVDNVEEAKQVYARFESQAKDMIAKAAADAAGDDEPADEDEGAEDEGAAE